MNLIAFIIPEDLYYHSGHSNKNPPGQIYAAVNSNGKFMTENNFRLVRHLRNLLKQFFIFQLDTSLFFSHENITSYCLVVDFSYIYFTSEILIRLSSIESIFLVSRISGLQKKKKNFKNQKFDKKIERYKYESLKKRKLKIQPREAKNIK